MPYLGNEVAPLVQALEGKELKLDSDGDSSIQASTDDTVVFKTNGSNRWTLNSSGNLFPASTSQGIVLGATSDTSANRLEDYEEGSFTVGIKINDSTSGIVFSVRSAEYIKIGKLVFINGDITLSDKGSSSGIVQIASLPFTIDDRTVNTSLDGSSGLCAYSSGTSGTHTPIGLVGQGGTTNVNMYVRNSGTGTMAANLGSTQITDSFSIRFSLTYKTT